MYKKLVTLALAASLCGALSAQAADPVVLSYQRNFIRASISTKLELLSDASRIGTVNMTPLYVDALAFVKQYYPVLGGDSQLLDIATVSVTKIASFSDLSAETPIEEIFSLIPDARVRIACIDSLSSLPQGGHRTEFLNNWFASAIDAAKPDATDVKTIAACATALGRIGDGSSFDALFKAANGSADSSVIAASTMAVNSLQSGYTDKILGKISQNNLQESYAAYSLAARKENLAASDRGKIAEAAFTVAVSTPTAQSGSQIAPETAAVATARAGLLKDSMADLKRLRWSQAGSAVTKYFYAVQADYKSGKTGIDRLIPVINCMGSMQSNEAAQALS
ncbi:MAG TPA: hypothetical protein PKO22_01190, partial [Treponemataceae bacterium]|nr:hypothetical protein [Treponemataceae bacterium]